MSKIPMYVFLHTAMLWLTLVASCVFAGERYLYANTRADGFNNQLFQIWWQLYLARRTGRIAALSDMWPDWTWDRSDLALHFPFEKYFAINQTLVRTSSLAQLGVACPQGLEFYGTPGWSAKHKLLVVKEVNFTVADLDEETWLLTAARNKDCVGLSAAHEIPSCSKYTKHISGRCGSPDWLAVRRAVDWNVNVYGAARFVLDVLNVTRFIALHVRRGDYLRGVCSDHAKFGVGEERFMCPNNTEIARAILALEHDRSATLVLTNDPKLINDLHRLLPTRTIRSIHDLTNERRDELRQKFGLEKFDYGAIDQALGGLADVFVGVPVSSFSETIMSGRDVRGVPYELTLKWQDALT
jgi:hypothetical protein